MAILALMAILAISVTPTPPATQRLPQDYLETTFWRFKLSAELAGAGGLCPAFDLAERCFSLNWRGL